MRGMRGGLWGMGLILLAAAPGWGQQPLPQNQLIFVHADGTDPAQLTQNLWRLEVDQPQLQKAVTQFQAPALTVGTPVLSRDRRRVAFTSNGNLLHSLETVSVFVMNPDGTGLQQITGFGTLGALPGPTGTVTGRVQAEPIAGAGAPTIGSCIVSAPGTNATASCSPDGSFELQNVPAAATFVKVQASVDYAGVGGALGLSYGFTQITVQPGGVTDAGTITIQPQESRSIEPSWSPDGTQLVVTDETNGSVLGTGATGAPELKFGSTHQLAIWSADGQPVRALSIPNHPEISLVGSDWSPVEDRIACGAWSSPSVLLLLNPDGSQLQAIYQAPSAFGTFSLVTQCRWSPDGTRIAFVQSDTDLNTLASWSDLYVVNRDGTGLEPITTNGAGQFVVSPSWSPDGSSIAFGYAQQGNPGTLASADLFVKPLGQTGFVQLTNDGRSSQPAW